MLFKVSVLVCNDLISLSVDSHCLQKLLLMFGILSDYLGLSDGLSTLLGFSRSSHLSHVYVCTGDFELLV